MDSVKTTILISRELREKLSKALKMPRAENAKEVIAMTVILPRDLHTSAGISAKRHLIRMNDLMLRGIELGLKDREFLAKLAAEVADNGEPRRSTGPRRFPRIGMLVAHGIDLALKDKDWLSGQREAKAS